MFTHAPFEQTTAATDAILAVIALLAAFYMKGLHHLNPWKMVLWRGVFTLLFVAAFLGAVAHGFRFEPDTLRIIWHPLYLCLVLVVAYFILAVSYDLWGYRVARRLMPAILVSAFIVFAATVFQDNFRFFIAFEVIGMLFALCGYLWLVYKSRPGALLMAAGVLVTILAAILQTIESLRFSLIWAFDHNGIYHLIQIPGVLLLVAGLYKTQRKTLGKHEKSADTA